MEFVTTPNSSDQWSAYAGPLQDHLRNLRTGPKYWSAGLVRPLVACLPQSSVRERFPLSRKKGSEQKACRAEVGSMSEWSGYFETGF